MTIFNIAGWIANILVLGLSVLVWCWATIAVIILVSLIVIGIKRLKKES